MLISNRKNEIEKEKKKRKMGDGTVVQFKIWPP